MADKPPLVTISTEQSRAIFSIVVPLNIISICFCLIAVSVYFLIRHQYSSLADRVSFRLSTAITISDIMYSIFQITSLMATTPGPLCSFTVRLILKVDLTHVHIYNSYITQIFYRRYGDGCSLVYCRYSLPIALPS